MPRRPRLPLRWPALRRRGPRPGRGWLPGEGRRSARAERSGPGGRFMLGRAPEPPAPRGRRLAWLTWRRAAIALTLLVLAPAAGLGALELLWGDTLRVQEVRVDGVEVTHPLAVAAAAGVEGDSLLWLDEAAAARRIEQLPTVREARVSREWPRAIAVVVVEEQGWGYWQRGDVRRVIDADGRVLTHGRPPAPEAVTIFEVTRPAAPAGALRPDPDTVRLVDRLLQDSTFTRLRVTPRAFVFDPERGLAVVTEESPDALFGDSHDYDFKIAAWGALLDRIERDRLEVSEIDLRFGRRMVLR